MGSFLGAFPHLFVSTTSLVYIVFSRLFVCNVGQMAIIYIFFSLNATFGSMQV